MATPIRGLDPTAVGLRAGAAFDPTKGDPSSSSFADIFQKALGEIGDAQSSARDAMSAFVRGEDVELHDVMAAAEEAGIALELLIEVRNKLVEAYRTLANMQG